MLLEIGIATTAVGLGIIAAPAVIGVGTVGPDADGYFAAAQTAGWVSAGSTLARVQSAIMTGGVTAVGIKTTVAGVLTWAFSYLL